MSVKRSVNVTVLDEASTSEICLWPVLFTTAVTV
jgi:hypothetical protein